MRTCLFASFGRESEPAGGVDGGACGIVGGRGGKDCGGAVLCDERGAGVFTQDAGGGGECVGNFAAVGDDSDGAAGGEAEPGARVHDVAEALAVDVDELFGVARGGDGGVGEEEDEGRGAWLFAVGGDAPAGLARGRVADDDVSGESDAGGGEAS